MQKSFERKVCHLGLVWLLSNCLGLQFLDLYQSRIAPCTLVNLKEMINVPNPLNTAVGMEEEGVDTYTHCD